MNSPLVMMSVMVSCDPGFWRKKVALNLRQWHNIPTLQVTPPFMAWYSGWRQRQVNRIRLKSEIVDSINWWVPRMTYKSRNKNSHKLKLQTLEVYSWQRAREQKYLVCRGLHDVIIPHKLEHGQNKASLREVESKRLPHIPNFRRWKI